MLQYSISRGTGICSVLLVVEVVHVEVDLVIAAAAGGGVVVGGGGGGGGCGVGGPPRAVASLVVIRNVPSNSIVIPKGPRTQMMGL